MASIFLIHFLNWLIKLIHGISRFILRKKGCQWCQIYQIPAVGFDNGFPRNLGIVEGENRVFQKKDMGRGQNVVDEVRGTERGLVDEIDKLVETLQRSKCSKAENDKDGNSIGVSIYLRVLL